MRPDVEIAVSPILRRRLRDLGAAAYPAEACGVLLGRAGSADPGTPTEVVEIVPLTNRSAAPETSSRLDPAELEPHLRRGDLVGFFHSHPHGRAGFSARDAREAWPAYWYLVVGAGPGGRGRLTAWRTGRRGRLTTGPVPAEPAEEVR